ncbi:MAG TPA: hypothetical protein VHY09_02785 [Candidatus Methylacidiphilales bacterium]|jgi:hypothetical protein|nr:hypothetical protein [Candidatus Methylacidiphilales bacterium]
MSRLTLKFSPETAHILKVVAAKKEISKRKYVLGVLNRALKREKRNLSAYDLMKDVIGCFDSGKRDVSTNPKYMKGFGKWRR